MSNAYTTQSDTQAIRQENQRRTRAIWISTIVGSIFMVTSMLLLAQGAEKLAVNIWGLGVTITLSLTSFGSAWLAWRKSVTAAGILLLSSILLISLVTPIIGHGQGIAIGILVAILGIGITASTLPMRYSVPGNSVSLLTGAAIVVLDQYLPDFGFYTEPIYTNVFAVVLSAVFLVIIARQFNRFTLRAKLVIAFAVITIIPLVILGIYNSYTSAQTLTSKSHGRLSDLSLVVKEQFDDFFTEQQDNIRTEVQQSAIVDYLLLAPQDRAGSLAENKADSALFSFQRRDPIFIESYTILDTAGTNILDTHSEHVGSSEKIRSYFTEVIKTGAPFKSSVLFLGENKKSIYFSAPIKDPAGKIIGALVCEYRATVLQKIARTVAPDDPNIIVSVVDQKTYMRLAYTGNRTYVFKSYKPFSLLDVVAFQSEGKMPPGKLEDIILSSDEKTVSGIDSIINAEKGTFHFFDAFSLSLNSNSTSTGVKMDTQPWIILVRESYAGNQAAVEKQQQNTILLSLAMAGLAILFALGGAQVLASPIVALTKVSEQIAAGDINARAQINTLDEIGNLAVSFNRMADELNITLSSLEERVLERTADLEAAKEQSEKRAVELQSVGEISKIITSEQQLDVLLPLITRLVSERFSFYHTGIFLLNETKQFAVLQAANSEGGRRMLARGHRLELGYGIVGYVAKTGIHRIALDVGSDSIYFNNPDLPTTRSEMALPLKIRNRVIGVLDVQSEKPKAFTENDARNLSILADQIAITLENAQLFERTQQALNEAQMLYRQNVQEGWSMFSRQEETVGYRQSMKGGEKLKDPVETDEIREVINRGNSLYFNTDGERESYIVVPVKLRGQVIGTLNVKAPTKERQWTSDETNFVEAIAERLSIALENARLIQESQQQVMKQQTIRDMTEKIGSSINLKNVLQSAVEELGRIMPGSEIILKLSQKDSRKQD
jgi:GAF domain-containing protein/HAMP domain-containing protein